MVNMIGDVARLRPHIKTHKTAEIIKMQQEHGIFKYKCATIPEASLLGKCGAEDALLALQPVGINVSLFFDLIATYPKTTFTTLVDNFLSVQSISRMAKARKTKVGIYLDLNTGMNRTGIPPGKEAVQLYKKIHEDPFLIPRGLHAYDGHIRNVNIDERIKACNAAFESVLQLRITLEGQGIAVESIIAGGSPTFPVHCRRKGVEASPGTTLLWDEGYASSFEDMPFVPAAVLISRIISKPKSDLVCLDLGHKSIAPEMEFPRARILGMEDCDQIGQSEEHLVLKCPPTSDYAVGELFYAIPMHICPTVAKYPELLTVENNLITGKWRVAARDHC